MTSYTTQFFHADHEVVKNLPANSTERFFMTVEEGAWKSKVILYEEDFEIIWKEAPFRESEGQPFWKFNSEEVILLRPATFKEILDAGLAKKIGGIIVHFNQGSRQSVVVRFD